MDHSAVTQNTGKPAVPMKRRAVLFGSAAAAVALSGIGILPAGRRAVAQSANRSYRLSVDMLDGRQMYNGKSPGPVMRVRPGETLAVELINDLPPLHDDCTDNPNQPHGRNTTNLHTHGLHVSPTTDSTGSFDADNVFVSVVPEDQFVPCADVCGVDVEKSFRYGRNAYRFELPDTHPTGTFWYHAHKHGSAAEQVGHGLAGALIVEDASGAMPPYIENAEEKILFISNNGIVLVDEAGGGIEHPEIEMRPGEVQRWRVINGTGNGTDFAYLRPSVANLDMHLIAFDGLTQTRRVRVDFDHPNEPWLNPSALASGNQADFIVRAPDVAEEVKDSSGLLAGLFESFSDAGITRFVDLKVSVSGDPVNADWSEDDALPGPGLDPFDDTELPTREIRFTRQRTINLGSYDGEVQQTMVLDTAEDWTVRNNTQVVHVYHIHVNPFFVTSINDEALPEDSPLRRWQDTIGVPLVGRVGFKTRFETFTGKFVIHCHVLPHEDSGMMQVVEVVA